MAGARERVAAARLAFAAGFTSTAISAGYYAMLYAARAALSEEDRNAKTHSGTWMLFGETFVATGRFERDLLERARKTQPVREAADYDAQTVPPEEAEALITLAEEFVAAVERLLSSQ